MTYAIHFSKQAFRDLEKIHEPIYSNIKQAINALARNPRPYGYRKLKGRTGYRIRVGDYRVIYDISDKELTIDIITLGNRKNVYD